MSGRAKRNRSLRMASVRLPEVDSAEMDISESDCAAAAAAVAAAGQKVAGKYPVDAAVTSEADLEKLHSVDMDVLKSKYNPEYNLRKKTIVNRIKTEKKKQLPKQPKPKTSPAPLSKYRRRAANARERTRMEDINGAFETLKSVLPNIEEGPNFKMTKITTLRLAMNYISALRDMLGYGEQEDLSSDFSSDLGSELNSDGDSSGTPSVSSSEDSCLSPDSMDGNFLTMDFLSEVKLDDLDTDGLLLDCT